MATDGEGIREINGQQVKVTPKTEDIIKKAEKDFSSVSSQDAKTIRGAAEAAKRIEKMQRDY